MLKLQGKSQKTMDASSRAVRRITSHFDCCPDQLSLEQREKCFSDLVESHSWSSVKVDRNGLQLFWKHVLECDWQWVNIGKAPKVRSLPDILTTTEVEDGFKLRKVRLKVDETLVPDMAEKLLSTLGQTFKRAFESLEMKVLEVAKPHTECLPSSAFVLTGQEKTEEEDISKLLKDLAKAGVEHSLVGIVHRGIKAG